MSVSISPLQEVAPIVQGKKYAASIRFWHWASAIVVFGSLITVLINSTLFEDEGIRATPGGRELAHVFEEKIWGVHIYFGYALAALLVFRMIAGFFQPAGQQLSGRIKIAYLDYFVLKRNKAAAGHDLIVKSSYLVFYVLLFIMAITGLVMAFDQQLGIPRNIVHPIKEFHGFCMYLIILFIAAHFVGVFRAEQKNSQGIVSDMINGGKVH